MYILDSYFVLSESLNFLKISKFLFFVLIFLFLACQQQIYPTFGYAEFGGFFLCTHCFVSPKRKKWDKFDTSAL